jgi:hypothetical protein
MPWEPSCALRWYERPLKYLELFVITILIVVHETYIVYVCAAFRVGDLFLQSSTLTTVLVWMVALAVGWEIFHYIQVIGFSVTLIGFFMFKEIIPMDWLFGPPEADNEEVRKPPTVDSIYCHHIISAFQTLLVSCGRRLT